MNWEYKSLSHLFLYRGDVTSPANISFDTTTSEFTLDDGEQVYVILPGEISECINRTVTPTIEDILTIAVWTNDTDAIE